MKTRFGEISSPEPIQVAQAWLLDGRHGPMASRGAASRFLNLPIIARNGTGAPQRQAAHIMERAMKTEGLTLPRVWGTNLRHPYTPEQTRRRQVA